jgi:hypothetical protein
MMRTTIRLEESLFAEAKQRAARGGITLTALIEQALRESFGRRQTTPLRRPVQITTWGHGGALPGVDLDNSAALLEQMDLAEREDAPT